MATADRQRTESTNAPSRPRQRCAPSTDRQAAQVTRIRRTRGGIWRAYEMKEQFRAIFAGDF